MAIPAVSPALLRSLDRRLPRYTSYPTAVQFGSEVDGAAYARWLQELPAEEALSLYLHVPFCAKLCHYCGCHTSVARTYEPVERYVELMEREIALLGRHLGMQRKAVHVHWGGGTPTMLSPADFQRIMRGLRGIAAIGGDCEVAIEIDPRTLAHEMVLTLADAGVTRASLGVQDFDRRVQVAVGRVQSYEVTARAAGWLRAAGITNINLDLMYGLPYQTEASVAATVRQALALDPERVALFGYAHVPWMKKHQRLLPEAALPDAAARLAQALVAADVLRDAGYRQIGLDHFAKASDALAVRQRERRLHRNFQGYTTDEAATLIGLGASSIGSLPQGYVQNAARTVNYRDAIIAGTLATARGCRLTDDDRLRREIIERLMCDLEVDLAAVAGRYGKHAQDFADELAGIAPLAEHGLVAIADGVVSVAEHARLFVRHVCAAFDSYLAGDVAGSATRYSRAL
ncbi:MAG TPA: oxygen-independent coproporphyrinogen III oxidase [Hyphomicrobiaceae bacterium]|nr:oxygen-independent coproporphyrinogen III oxidase [Hyphomicrobiaceae bacterium]